jgi:hypothetical protein
MTEWVNECKRVKNWNLQQPCFEIRCSRNRMDLSKRKEGNAFWQKAKTNFDQLFSLGRRLVIGSKLRTCKTHHNKKTKRMTDVITIRRPRENILWCHRMNRVLSPSDTERSSFGFQTRSQTYKKIGKNATFTTTKRNQSEDCICICFASSIILTPYDTGRGPRLQVV